MICYFLYLKKGLQGRKIRGGVLGKSLEYVLSNFKLTLDYIDLFAIAGTVSAIIFFSIIWNIFPLAKFIRINNIDIVHGNDLRINLTWSVATIFSQPKFIWHQRTILSTSRLWRFIPFLSNHFIGISKSVINSAPQNIRPSNISLVYNAVNSNLRHNAYLSRKSIIEEYEMSSDAIILGYVGRLVSYKNVDFLIRCVSVLIKMHKKIYIC